MEHNRGVRRWDAALILIWIGVWMPLGAQFWIAGNRVWAVGFWLVTALVHSSYWFFTKPTDDPDGWIPGESTTETSTFDGYRDQHGRARRRQPWE
jgi:hypothetical protein